MEIRALPLVLIMFPIFHTKLQRKEYYMPVLTLQGSKNTAAVFTQH